MARTTKPRPAPESVPPVIRAALDTALVHAVWLKLAERAAIRAYLAGPHRPGDIPDIVREVLQHTITYSRFFPYDQKLEMGAFLQA